MSAAETMCFLYGYAVVIFVCCICAGLRTQSRNLFAIALLLVALIGATCVVAIKVAGETPVSSLWSAVADARPRPVLAAIAGCCAPFTAIFFAIEWRKKKKEEETPNSVPWINASYWALLIGGLAIGGPAIVGASLGLLSWDLTYDIQLSRPQVFHDMLAIKKVADVPMPPVRIAAASGDHVYVSTFFCDDVGKYGGTIYCYDRGHEDAPYDGRVVAASHVLHRPFGLAVSENALYVSRSGHAAWARNGAIVDQSCGAVTCMKDLNNDRYFEYMDDLVRDLPGAGGPDTMHQNNGIAVFGDALYLALGMNSDRDLDERMYSGTILKVEVKSGAHEIFAEGFRNPFGIAVNREEEVFVTDNDSSEDAGDELNHVIRGQHYGHPYADGGEHGHNRIGFQNPILKSDTHSNFGGIAFAYGDLLPRELQGNLLVCDIGNNQVLSIQLKRKNNSFACQKVDVLAKIHSPVDIAVDAKGLIYVVSRYYKAVYVIEPRNHAL